VTQLDGLRRYIEAATTLTQITRGRAEELVKELVASGEVERNRAQDWIEGLMKKSREASEALMVQVSTEVDRQLGDLGLKNFDLDDLAAKVAGIIDLAGTLGRNVTHGHGTGQATTQPAHPNGNGTHATTAAKKGQKKEKSGDKKTAGKDSSTKTSEKKKTSAAKSEKGAKSPKSADAKKQASKKPAAEQPTTASESDT
jgi:polyhydroxyalkanoate synthesis regulator phasin